MQEDQNSMDKTTAGQSLASDAQSANGTSIDDELNLRMLMNVSLPVRIRFGSTTILFGDVMNLQAGDRIELDSPLEDPVDVMIGDKVVAQGEVVVVDGCYAVRIQRIVDQGDRLESLKLN
jgi:flagellar motor switch protein FliN